MGTARWKNDRGCLYFAAIKKPCHCFETLPRTFLCPACVSVYVRRWLWKLAGLYNREEPRVIWEQTISVEYCPGEKCGGVKGENKIRTPTNLRHPLDPQRYWMAVPRSRPQPPRQSLACLLGLDGDVWRKLKNLLCCQRITKLKMSCKMLCNICWNFTPRVGCRGEAGGRSDSTSERPVWEWNDMIGC